MTNNKTSTPNGLIGLLVVIIVGALGAGIASYHYGHNQGFSKGYSRGRGTSWQLGYDKGHQDGLAEVQPRITDDERKLTESVSSYNALVNDYNNLRTAAIRYMGAIQYKVYSPVTCNTHTYGSLGSSSTTCY